MKSLGIYIIVWVTTFVSLFGYGQSTYPYLKTPISDAVIDTRETEVVFSWNQTQTGSYVLEIADNIDFTGLTIYSTTDLNRTVPRNELPLSGFWRVRSGNTVTAARSFEQLDLNTLDNLVYHIDANEGVEVSGDRLVRWNNLAQDDYHAQQPVSNSRPYLSNDMINNRDVISFGGNNGSLIHYLNMSNLLALQEDFTLFTFYVQKGFNTGLSYLLGNGEPISGVFTGGTSVSNFGLTSPTEAYLISGSTSFHWGLRTLRDDKIALNTVNQNLTLIGSTDIPLLFSAIGTRPDQTNLNFFGDLAEIILFDKDLSSDATLKIENYLYTKYLRYPNLGNDLVTCAPSTKIGINPDPIYSAITWSTGATASDSITVTNNGWYWVEATALGRTYRDSIYVSGLVPKPQLSQVGAKTICLGDELNLTALNTAPAGINYQWSDGSSDAALPVTEAGTYSLTYVDDSGCAVASESLTVSVNDFPATAGLGPDRSVCRNTNIYFDNMGKGQAPYTYAWQGGGTAPFRTATNTGSQTFTIAVTDAIGCVANDEVVLNVSATVAPEVAFEYDTVCPLATTNLRGTSVATGGDPLTNQLWNILGANLQGASVDYTPTTMQPYPVIHIVQSQSGCSNVLIDTVRLLPQPQVEYQVTGSCAESPYQFIAGQLSPEQIVDWKWYFEAPDTDASTTASGPVGNYMFDEPGIYNVSLVGTDMNTCRDSLTQQIEVAPVPQVDFTVAEGCVGDVVQFTNTTILPAPYTVQGQTWQFGEGTSSGQVNPSKPYFMAGEYSVTLTVTSSNGCIGTANKMVKVHAIPQPDFYTDADCAGVATWFSDSSFVPNGSVAEVFWDYGDGATGEGFNAYHAYEAEGTYTVKQRVRSSFGCENTIQRSVSLNDYLKIDFTLSPFALLADYPTEYVNLSEGATTYNWDFGGIFESEAVSPDFIFGTEYIGDTITIALSGSNNVGCTDTKTTSFVVRRKQTDLAIRQLFVQEENGFYIIGAELENKGTTPITQADLFLRTSNLPVVREVWTGLLETGERKIHVFTAQPPVTQDQNAQPEDYICVEGQIVSEFGFEDEDFSNNELCRHLTEAAPILLLPYPNPTTGAVTIRVLLPEAQEISLAIYDAYGKKITQLAEETPHPKGLSRFHVDLTPHAQGTYTIFLTTAEGEKRSLKVLKM